jgi:hypothetical protein
MVLLRLEPGGTIAGAEARLDTETRRLANQREKKGRLVRLVPAGTLLPLPKEARMFVVMFYGVLISVVLGLTCANLGGLLLARGAARGPEFAIRLSIGAGRRRLIRQLLTESAMFAAAGGAGGIVAASGIFRLLRSMQTASNPGIDGMTSGPDLQVALFTFGIAAVAAVGFGLLPALAITRLDLMNAMKVNQTTALHRYRRLGLRNGFVVCQGAAAMMLVLIMGFFVVGVQVDHHEDDHRAGHENLPFLFACVCVSQECRHTSRGQRERSSRTLRRQFRRLRFLARLIDPPV